MTEKTGEALNNLRDPLNLMWYILPLAAFVVYVYANEIERKNWSMVFAGLSYWGMEWFNEIVNVLIFKYSKYAPVWLTPGKSSFIIFIGLNVEICFVFSIAGVVFFKVLPRNRQRKILWIPNRIFFTIFCSAFTIGVEMILSHVGLIVWEYSWWSSQAPWSIFFFGYLHVFLVALWVYDMRQTRKKIVVTAVIYGMDLLLILVFGVILAWL